MKSRRRFNTALQALVAAGIAFASSLIVFADLLPKLNAGWASGDLMFNYVDADLWSWIDYRWTDQFGYPFGIDRTLIPSVDVTQNLMAQAVNALGGSPFAGINLMIVLSFPLVAALTVVLFRLVGVSGPLAIALALIFTFLPFHWGRALGHSYLASMYSIVTGMILVLLVGSGLLAKELASRERRLRFSLCVVALVIVTAWSGIYYAAFTVILVLGAVAWRVIRGDRWRAVLVGVIPAVGIVLAVLIALIPSIIARLNDPPLAPLSERLPLESVLFAGALVLALLPLPMNVLPYGGYYNEWALGIVSGSPTFENLTPTNYGTVLTTVSLGIFIFVVVIRTRRKSLNQAGVSPGLVLTLLATTLVFFVPWSLNMLTAVVLTPQIRAWNRLLPLLLLLFLIGLASVARDSALFKNRSAGIAVLIAAVVITTIESIVPFRQPFLASARQGDLMTRGAQEYARQVNTQINPGCGILQLPYVAFPESGNLPARIVDYDPFWPSITNSNQRWSYGAVKNTAASVWASQLPQTPDRKQIALLEQAGFCAIHLDRAGFDANQWPEVDEYFAQLLGVPVATALDGRWLLYKLPDPTPLPPREVWSQSLVSFLLPPFIQTDPASLSRPQSELTSRWSWLHHRTTTLTVTSITDEVPVLGVRGQLAAPPCESVVATVQLVSGNQIVAREFTLPAKSVPTPFALAFDPHVHAAELIITASGSGCLLPGDPSLKYLQLIDIEAITPGA